VKPTENNEEKYEDSFEDDDAEQEDTTEDVANELPYTDEKHLETKMEENEYSKLSSDSDQSKAALGKGFWISVMIFVVVVVVGAYLYLFVYDTGDKGTTAENGRVNEQAITNDNAPPAVSDLEQQPAEPVEQAVPQQRDVVRIQGTGENSFYRDGSGERMVANTIFEKDGLYSVQVSSFKTQDVAEKDARRIQKLGHETFIVKAFVPKLNAEYYRVRVGYFNTQEEAEEFSKSFKR
jgi:cell division septation protein DedD